MAADKDKFVRMLDELARQYPESAEIAMDLQDSILSADGEEAPVMPEEDAEFDLTDEDEDLPPSPKKKIPSDLADEEDEEEDLF